MQESKTNETNKKSKINYILILIIILLIIIIILLLLNYKNIGKQKKLTGNTDIFEINCDCNNNNPDNNTTSTPNPSSSSTPNTNNTVKNPSQSTETKTPNEGITIEDNDIIWESSNTLRIFKNPVYEMEEVIAPGSSNSYNFVVKNNSGCKMTYRLEFQEKNDYNINMKYKLKKNGKYISKEWTAYDNIKESKAKLNYQEQDNYVLEWKWIESDNDTEVGANINSSYKLIVQIIGESGI